MQRLLTMPRIQADNWGDLFWHLGQQVRSGRVIVVFDEISWMGSKDPMFLGQLKNAWDLYFSKNPELILILCGSVSSWIEKNIISSTGFLGRIDVDLQLGPLPLKDCAAFWGKELGRVSPYEKLKTLTVVGGVPKYLELIDHQLSAEENLKRMCFRTDGFLYNEFELIFSDIFSKKSESYKRIVECLSGPPLTLDALSRNLGRAKGSPLLSRLHDLVLSGFVSEETPWDLKTLKHSKFKQYRLSDNYIRFYLRAIRLLKASIEQSMFKMRGLSNLHEWNSWLGLQFENLVLQNIGLILTELNIDSAEVLRFGSYFQRANSRQQGCQVDLLIQTSHGIMYLCEVKFSKHPLGVAIIKELKDKVKRFSKPHNHSLRVVLIHVNGIEQNVQESGFFDYIVDFSRFIS